MEERNKWSTRSVFGGVELEPWGERPIERALDAAKRRGVEMTWRVHEIFMDDPKVRVRVERARSRGHRVEIDLRPPRRTIIIGHGSSKGKGCAR